MTRSETVNELATALAEAQAAIGHAKKDAENPHFRARYADLASIWDACRGALSARGLSVVQSPRLVLKGEAGESMWLVEVESTLLHSSGQFVSDVLAVPVSPASAQAVGSAITYARRYALAALVGVAPAQKVYRAPAPAPGPHGSRVKVLGVVQRTMPDEKVKFIISADDHKTYHSFNVSHATKAKDAQAAGLEVAIAYLAVPDGRLIQSIDEVEAPL
jgi:hypothetical protein